MKYACIRKYSHEHSVKTMCRVLSVSTTGFYKFLKAVPSLRSQEDLKLRQEISKIHAEHRWTPGAVKTWRLLNSRGIRCGKHRVARLRKIEGIQSCRSKRFRVMHSMDRAKPPAPDMVKRAFTVDAPNKVWVGDMTAIRTKEGWLHLAIVVDLFARRVVGWAMGNTQATELPLSALKMAIAQRKPPVGLISHSDQGSVYASATYSDHLAENGIKASMSRKGNCHDNAVAESFFSNLKNEVMHEHQFATRADAKAVVSEYIEMYYNRKRLHQTLGYQTPEAVEAQFNVTNKLSTEPGPPQCPH